jgi:hypothetical protein
MTEHQGPSDGDLSIFCLLAVEPMVSNAWTPGSRSWDYILYLARDLFSPQNDMIYKVKIFCIFVGTYLVPKRI